MKEPKPMREIHAIREKISREDRCLTRRQRVEKTHRVAAELMQKYGLKFRHLRKSAA